MWENHKWFSWIENKIQQNKAAENKVTNDPSTPETELNWQTNLEEAMVVDNRNPNDSRR